jgi:hypothetical protein
MTGTATKSYTQSGSTWFYCVQVPAHTFFARDQEEAERVAHAIVQANHVDRPQDVVEICVVEI